MSKTYKTHKTHKRIEGEFIITLEGEFLIDKKKLEDYDEVHIPIVTLKRIIADAKMGYI